MKTHRIGVRVSAELHALLAAAGDVSAATRALAILGASVAGYAQSVLRDEAAGLLVAQLDEPVRQALRALISGRSTPVPQLLDISSTGVEPMLNTPVSPPPFEPFAADPLANIGIEV